MVADFASLPNAELDKLRFAWQSTVNGVKMMRIYDKRMAAMADNDRAAIDCGESRLAEFHKRVEKGDGCWLWAGHISVTGYGHFNYAPAKKITAHRMSLLLHVGVPPQGGYFYACHKCLNKNCVRPEHLYWGTPHENVIDAWADPERHTDNYRMRMLYAEKLSNDDVRAIWHKYYFESATLADLASAYDCNSRYIQELMKGTYRGHITKHLPKPKGGRKRKVTIVGERSAKAIFTNKQVQAIRRLACGFHTEREIADALGADRNTIVSILTNRTWSQIPWPEGCKPLEISERLLQGPAPTVRNQSGTRSRNLLSGHEVREIFNSYWWHNGNQRIISTQYGIHHGLVSQIVNKLWGAEYTADLELNPKRKRLMPEHRKTDIGNAKLSEAQVQEIRLYIDAGASDAHIASKYAKANANMIACIRTGSTWSNLPWPKK